jgi:excisionase family DNA binding protein
VEKRFLRVEEAGEALGISRAQAYKYIAAGELRATKLGRSTRIASEDLNAFVAAKRQETRREPVAV